MLVATVNFHSLYFIIPSRIFVHSSFGPEYLIDYMKK